MRRIEWRNGGELMLVEIAPGTPYASDAVTPLIFVDFSEDDEIVSLTVNGKDTQASVLRIFAENWNGSYSDADLLADLATVGATPSPAEGGPDSTIRGRTVGNVPSSVKVEDDGEGMKMLSMRAAVVSQKLGASW